MEKISSNTQSNVVLTHTVYTKQDTDSLVAAHKDIILVIAQSN